MNNLNIDFVFLLLHLYLHLQDKTLGKLCGHSVWYNRQFYRFPPQEDHNSLDNILEPRQYLYCSLQGVYNAGRRYLKVAKFKA